MEVNNSRVLLRRFAVRKRWTEYFERLLNVEED